jgi:uncharacterized protein (TIGR03382 family)
VVTDTGTAVLGRDAGASGPGATLAEHGCSCSFARSGLSATWMLLVLSGLLVIRARRRR